ncbi:hypothetical protein ACIFQM_11145 [Paenibacillus sp. NRS-1782]|uniref:hypothetical protein n=1 Tax=unclassified Paenibacillus TaxID=185978 RepID=UPI003D265327
MTKLNVTVPAVDVEVSGVRYRKVDRDARVGDIIRYEDENGYVTKGAFYAVTQIDVCGDPHIEDNDGDDFDLCGEEFEVYAKVSETSAAYREVKRHAKVGERIRIVRKASGEGRYENGAEFVVNSTGKYSDVRVTVGSSNHVMVLLREYVVLEPVTSEEPAPKRLKVGEFAKVIGPNDNANNYEIGSIVEIVEVEVNGVRGLYVAKRPDGTLGNNLRTRQVVRATDEEVAEVKRKLTVEVGSTVRLTIKDGASPHYGWGEVNNGAVGTVRSLRGEKAYVDFPQQDDWTALLTELTPVSDGEKTQPQPQPVRFKVGEFARTLVAKSGIPKGSIVKITRDDEDSRPFRSVLLDGSNFEFYRQDELERVDAETVKWAVIGRKVNTYRDGDVVQFTKDTGATGYPSGSIAVIRNVSGTRFDFGDSVYSPYGGESSWVKLVAPVEQRFDRMEVEAKAAA